MVLQGHFTASAKHFAQSTAGHTPNGDLTNSIVPSDGTAVPHRAVERRDR